MAEQEVWPFERIESDRSRQTDGGQAGAQDEKEAPEWAHK
jgi:hypothetical protein